MSKIREATDLMHETRRSNNPSCTRCAGERSEQQTLLRASERASKVKTTVLENREAQVELDERATGTDGET